MLTPAERRGAALVVVLLVLGTGWDLWRAGHPRLVRLRLRADSALTSAEEGGAAEVPAGSVARGRSVASPREVSQGTASRDAAASATPLNLNHANAAELDGLPGIGPVLARRILEHRREHGGFLAIEELLAVPGIGPRLFARLRPHVRV